MTTTISKHEIQQQQHQHQYQQQQHQQQGAIMIGNIATTTTGATIERGMGTTEQFYGSIDPNAMQLQFDTLNNNDISGISPGKSESETGRSQGQSKGLKRRSLLNFKSFDFHIRSLYSGLRTSGPCGANGAGGHKLESASRSSSLGTGGLLDTGRTTTNTSHNRIPPHLRIEGVDRDPELDAEQEQESMNTLLDYTTSSFTPRHNSSSQLLPMPAFSSSLSPYYLSPYMAVGGYPTTPSPAATDDCSSGNIRRSSTSDIVACRRRGSSSSSNSRRPSTTDLLRRARERRGSEMRMGRSVSHSAMRGGGGGGAGMSGGAGCMGGRRTSMAF